MMKKSSLTESVTLQSEYKRKFSLPELYRAFIYVPAAASKLIKNRNNQYPDKQFLERIQLAVTEVNGCAACSYQHTKMALQTGMSNEEISSLLKGESDFIKPEEAKGILFAQHFADSGGFPKKYAYEALVQEYGKIEAELILSAAQAMLAGNIYGIPFSAFFSRLQRKPYKGSTLFYELSMLIGGLLLLPIAIFHGLLRYLLGFSAARFDNSEDEENSSNKN